MIFEEAIRSMLIAGATGAKVSQRVFPHRAEPGTTPPYVMLSRVSAFRPTPMSGAASLAIARWQIDCFSFGYAEAIQMANAVRADLDNRAFSSGGITIQRMTVLSDLPELYEPETKLFHVPVEVVVAEQLTAA